MFHALLLSTPGRIDYKGRLARWGEYAHYAVRSLARLLVCLLPSSH